jgi:hypothetical protein
MKPELARPVIELGLPPAAPVDGHGTGAQRQGRLITGKESTCFHDHEVLPGELHLPRAAELAASISAAMQEPGRLQVADGLVKWRPDREDTDLLVTVHSAGGVTAVTVEQTIHHRLRRIPLRVKLAVLPLGLAMLAAFVTIRSFVTCFVIAISVSALLGLWLDALRRRAVDARVQALRSQTADVVALLSAAAVPAGIAHAGLRAQAPKTISGR